MVGKMGGFGLFGVVFKGRLSNDQINSWHNNTFDRTPWLGIYGGNIPFTDSMICSTCDPYNP
jgi:hypothetical protein